MVISMDYFLNLTGTALYITAAALVLCGTAECFFGFKLIKVVLVGCGLFAGASFGYTLGNAILTISSAQGSLLFWGQIGFALVFAFIISLLAFRFYLTGAFILNAFITFILTYSVCELCLLNTMPSVIISIVPALLIGLLSVKFFRAYKILISSIAGGFIIALGVYTLFKNRFGVMPNIITFIITAAAGMQFQLRTTKKTKA